MPIIKCQNPECDYFQKPVPEGDYCPFCGDPLPSANKKSSSPEPFSQQPSHSQNLSSSFPQPVSPPPVTPPVVQPSQPVSPPPVTPPVVQPSQPVFPPPVTPPGVQPSQPVSPPPVTPPVVQPSQPIPVSSFLETAPTVWEPRSSGIPVLKLIHPSREYTITGQKSYLGRRGGQKKPHPEIDITDLPYAERVSRPHAHIFWDETVKSYMIVDNQSANGTILNEETLKPWHPYPLVDGAILELGREHKIKFQILIR